MNKFMLVAISAALPIAVSACNETIDTPKGEASPKGAPNGSVSREMKTAKGTGTVAAIDAATGKITLDHAPVAELQWPAMTMGFNVNSGTLGGIAVGDKVAFEFQWDGRTAEVTSIAKQ